MPQSKLEKRLAALERQMAQLQAKVDKLEQPNDWRSTLGMFAGDEVMKQIFEEGRKIREKDRQKARKAAARTEKRERIAAE
jgi:hypothetical protein